MEIGKCLFIAAGQLYGRLLCQHKWFCVKMYTLLMDNYPEPYLKVRKLLLKDWILLFDLWHDFGLQASCMYFQIHDNCVTYMNGNQKNQSIIHSSITFNYLLLIKICPMHNMLSMILSRIALSP